MPTINPWLAVPSVRRAGFLLALLLITQLLGTGSANAQELVWRTAYPAPRYGHAMAFDSARGVTVLFGGTLNSSGARSGETWEWDGTNWRRRAVGASGPSWRTSHAMAYDAQRGVTVLFGGSDGTTKTDTWEWDGSSWTQRITPVAPPAGTVPAMTYDPVRGVSVLYSHELTGASQTWEWNGIQWTRRVTLHSPGPMQYGSFVYDLEAQAPALIGGIAGLSYYNSMWRFAGGDWVLIPEGGMSRERASTAAVWDPVRSVIVMACGRAYDSVLNDTWEWNGDAWTQRAGSTPGFRWGYAMVWDSVRNRAVLFGGTATTGSAPIVPLGDTWEWDGTTWENRNPSAPPPLYGAAMVFDSARGEALLFGGEQASSALRGETWAWDGEGWILKSVTGPSPRQLHAMAYDPVRRVVVLFGGSDSSGKNGETWEWNGSTWTRMLVLGPSPRYGSMMMYDPTLGRVLLVGGMDPARYRDIWTWDGTTWTLQDAAGLLYERVFGALLFDTARSMAVLFGGGTNTTAYDSQTHERDGSLIWHVRPTSPPVGRYGHAMVYHSQRQRTILFGGVASTGWRGDTIEWNATSWLSGPAIGPSARSFHAMAYDPLRNNVVLFGGSNTEFVANSETWVLASNCPSPTMFAAPSVGSVCANGSVSVSAAANGIAPIAYTWQVRSGAGWVTLDASPTWFSQGGSGRILSSSDGMAQLAVDAGPGIGAYQVRVIATNLCGSVTSAGVDLNVCRADLTCDGGVDINDLLAFLGAFEAGSVLADVDNGGGDGVPDGGVDINDLLFFLAQFEAGC